MRVLGKVSAWRQLQHCGCRVTGHGRVLPPHMACAMLSWPWSRFRVFPCEDCMDVSIRSWYLWAWAHIQPLPEKAWLLICTIFYASHLRVLMCFKGVFMVLDPVRGKRLRSVLQPAESPVTVWAPPLPTPCSCHSACAWCLLSLSHYMESCNLTVEEQQCTERLARLKHLPKAICL